jgi:hypothetical protein
VAAVEREIVGRRTSRWVGEKIARENAEIRPRADCHAYEIIRVLFFLLRG